MASSSTASPAMARSAREEAVLKHTQLNAITFEQSRTGDGREAAAAASATAMALAKLQRTLSASLPTRLWFALPLELDPRAVRVQSFRLTHGEALPELEVRVLHQHACISDPRIAEELDAALRWLLDSIAVQSGYPVLGLDCESDCSVNSDGEVRLLQLATGTRCLLIRIPPQRELQSFIQSAPLLNSNGARQILFTPSFHACMQNRAIFKSGAELWTDALDLWSCCPGVEVNSCLNMSWIFRNASGGALSLAAMVNLSLGADNAFIKDKETTTSSWGCEFLSIRQLIYAALDAQTSWAAGANQPQIPKPFHVSDLPRAWLQKAAHWKAVLRSHKIEVEARARDRERNNNLKSKPQKSGGNDSATQADIALLDAAHRYMARVMQGEEPLNPFVTSLLSLSFPSPTVALQSLPPPNVTELPAPPAGSLPISPTLFSSEDLCLDTSAVHSWWFSTSMEINFDYSYAQRAQWMKLHASQQKAVQEAERSSRIQIIYGAPGTGSTVTASALAACALTRTSSINLDSCPLAVRLAPQRVLCVCETETAARHLAHTLADDSFGAGLDASQLILFVSHDFCDNWLANETHYQKLRYEGYVFGLGVNGSGEGEIADRAVMVCTVDFALSTQFPHRLHHRQTVIIDAAHSLSMLKAVLFLRKCCPHMERLVLLGDDQQFPARIGRREVDSVLSTAYESIRATHASVSCSASISKQNFPIPFRHPHSTLLSHPFRLKPHLLSLVSSLFYSGELKSPSTDRSRVVGWVDVAGGAASARLGDPSDLSLGYSSQEEINAIVALWNSYAARQGFTADQIAILCLCEAQRRELITQQEHMRERVFTVEQFEGQECSVVLLSLSAPKHIPEINLRPRICVALTRACKKLFILGDRQALDSSAGAPESLWSLVEEFAYLDLEEVFPELALAGEQFPVLGGGGAAAPATSLAPAPASGSAAANGSAPAPVASSLPALDLQLIDALGQVVRSNPAMTLGDLQSSFLAMHGRPFSAYSHSTPEEFAQRYAACFPSRPNPAQPANPFVAFREPIGLKAAQPAAAPARPASAAALVAATQPVAPVSAAPKTVIASNHVLIPASRKPPRTVTLPSAAPAAPVAVPEPEPIAAAPVEPEETPEERQRKKLRAAEKKERLKREKEERREKLAAETAAAAAAKAASVVPADADGFSAVPARRAAKHPAALASALAAELAPPTRKFAVCPFCAQRVTPTSKYCAHCGQELVDSTPTTRAEAEESKQEWAGASASSSVDAHVAEEAGAEEEAAEEEASESKASEEAPAEVDAEAEAEEVVESDDHSESAVASVSSSSASVSAPPAAKSKSKAKKKGGSKPAEKVADYPHSMKSSTYLGADDLQALSKAAKKKLLWLCSACLGANDASAGRCLMCDAVKPPTSILRFQSQSSSLSVPTLRAPVMVAGGHRAKYESEWCHIVHSNQLGVHLVATKSIPAGTIILEDHTMWSPTDKGPRASPPQIASLVKQLLHDPMQISQLEQAAKSEISNPPDLPCDAPSWTVLRSYLPRAKDISMPVWQQAVKRAFDSHFVREGVCACLHGRFTLRREARLLAANCWPNCAVVQGHIDVHDTDVRAIMATCDIEAGSVLSDLMEGGQTSWLFLPHDHRSYSLEWEEYDDDLPCECSRCVIGGGATTAGVADAEKLMRSELHGFSYFSDQAEADYDDIVELFNGLPLAKMSVYSAEEIADLKKSSSEKDKKLLKSVLTQAEYDEQVDECMDLIARFLQIHPLARTHWRVQHVRTMYLQLLQREKPFQSLAKAVHSLTEKLQEWVRTHSKDLAQKSQPRLTAAAPAAAPASASASSSADSASQSVVPVSKKDSTLEFDLPDPTSMLPLFQELTQAERTLLEHAQIISEAIHANAIFFKPLEPAKGLALKCLDSFESALRASDVTLRAGGGLLEEIVQQAGFVTTKTEGGGFSIKPPSAATSSSSTAISAPSKSPEPITPFSSARSWEELSAGPNGFAPPTLHFTRIGQRGAQEAFFHYLRTVVEPHAEQIKASGYPRRANNTW